MCVCVCVCLSVPVSVSVCDWGIRSHVLICIYDVHMLHCASKFPSRYPFMNYSCIFQNI